MASTAIRQARSLHARASKGSSRSAVAELALVALWAEPDELVDYVEMQLPAVLVCGQPQVAALDAGRCLCDLRLHGNESMPRPSKKVSRASVRQSPYPRPADYL